ncbi:hypothetical protein LCGC14_0143660 [marine sediment metagenome]|uniref:DUF4391 domain-containing protein n=1 Tax=marine sediment metagenome TaxID=412755 RepID=A0A0F9VFT5_9ZZZZ
MMLLEALQLPDACLVQQKIPKKAIAANSKSSAAAARLLQDSVDSIQLLGHITPNNSNIAAYKDAEHEYLEILYISLQLKKMVLVSAAQLKSLHQLLHQSIAYPLILEISGQEGSQWSLAEKTINQARPEHEQLVIQELLVSDWQSDDSSPLQHQFHQSLSFVQQDYSHLMALYQSFLGCFFGYLTAASLGRATLRIAEGGETVDGLGLQQQREQLRKIQDLQGKIIALKSRRDACSQFNEKVELNVQLQRLQVQLKRICSEANVGMHNESQ